MPSSSLPTEKLLPLLWDNLRDYALYLMDVQGTILSWTPGVLRLMGYEAAEFVGQPSELIFTPEDRAAGIPDAEIERARVEGRCEAIRWHLRKDGTRFWANGEMIALVDEAGQLHGFAKLLRDDTLRKQAEDELRDARARLESALIGGSVATWDFDILHNRIFADANLARLFGVSPEDANGGPLDHYVRRIHPDDVEEVATRIARVIESGEPYESEYRVVHDDGSIHWLSTRGTVKKDEQGNAIAMPGVALDITFRKQAEETLRLAHQKAEETNRLKDEFLGTLSHELRSPLNAILGWANLLRTNQLDEATQHSGLEAIERNARAQAQLIEDLLDVSRILTGKLRLDLQPIELAQLVEEAVKNAAPAAQAKHIRLVSRIDYSTSLISGDPDRLAQILWNLLANAVKFTPKKGQITVSVEQAESQLRVQIADTGRGIAQEFLPYVFERFRQADASSTRTQGGLGIGLGLVRHLVEAHGGSVLAESAGEGQGATFSVFFPLMAVRPEKVAQEAEEPPVVPRLSGENVNLQTEPEADVVLPMLSGLRILVVDDDPDARSLTSLCLKQRGATVEAETSAATAFALFKQRRDAGTPFDVLVSDVGMPREDGMSLVRRVQQLEAQTGGFLPGVALTAYASPKDRMNTLLAGFQVHVAKPVKPLELVATVASLTGRTGHS